ncbi:hypothetical protein METEAL_33610 [Mesoterricola silvestris]|uniref:Uncharacterized protein n=1 Tax=Mesoterricola silvestris TaxID=2927979 RepID=A0AA48GMK6_9BACT|nr:hypothetical protein METEAL_33610 [Mesoterricola silvestris]
MSIIPTGKAMPALRARSVALSMGLLPLEAMLVPPSAE